jgi:hypothetical protein
MSEPAPRPPSPEPMPAAPPRVEPATVDSVCPVCGGAVRNEKCKVVCRSNTCGYRIILTCAEF